MISASGYRPSTYRDIQANRGTQAGAAEADNQKVEADRAVASVDPEIVADTLSIVDVAEMHGASLLDAVGRLAQDRELPERLVVRFFDRERTSIVTKTGTDRDGDSELYNCPRVDAPASARRNRSVPDSAVVYAWQVDLSTEPATVLIAGSADEPGRADAGTTLEAFLTEYKSQEPEKVLAAALYDPATLTRAAEVEYWFNGSPRDSLLAIVRPLENPRPPQATSSPTLDPELEQQMAEVRELLGLELVAIPDSRRPD